MDLDITNLTESLLKYNPSCFKVNFSAWLNEFRVEKAKEMLRDTRLSIREISLACGYTDANYFARVFKRITGKTPSEYRLT